MQLLTATMTDDHQEQVVPTPYSLKLLARRSREVQEKGGWVEYFDPDTTAFWYLEQVSTSSDLKIGRIQAIFSKS